MHGQLAHEITASDGAPALVISASREIEPGARAALLLADGLFRLDVLVRGDALQAVVRNMSGGPLQFHGDSQELGGETSTFGDVTPYSPGRTGLGFSLGADADRVLVKVKLGTLRLADRGTVRVTAQAIARPIPDSRVPEPPPDGA